MGEVDKRFVCVDSRSAIVYEYEWVVFEFVVLVFLLGCAALASCFSLATAAINLGLLGERVKWSVGGGKLGSVVSHDETPTPFGLWGPIGIFGLVNGSPY